MLKEVEIFEAIKSAYEPAAVVLKRVASKSAPDDRHSYRIADAVIVKLDGSKPSGVYATCVEIKTSRKDIMAEIKDAKKSAPFIEMCDEFVLCMPRRVYDLSYDIIPKAWGVFTVNTDTSIHVVRRGTVNENPQVSREMLESWIAAASRRYSDNGLRLVGVPQTARAAKRRVPLQPLVGSGGTDEYEFLRSELKQAMTSCAQKELIIQQLTKKLTECRCENSRLREFKDLYEEHKIALEKANAERDAAISSWCNDIAMVVNP